MLDDIEKTVEELKTVIKDLYLSDQIPWIIGYSGGKDSSTCVELVWMALLEIPEEKRKKNVYVISTDTLVENPVVAAWVENSLKKMGDAARQASLPFVPTRLYPELKDRFWVNLIGRGYPAPRPRFRWCTERLKIQTATRFIQSLAESNGEAILVLGTRRKESSVRAHTISKYEHSSRDYLSRNGDPKLSRVWVYTPIVDWDNDDVWEFIGTFKNPWGVDSSELLDLYRGATPDNECPLVTDTDTQSCGDSRFGCFVCTMVSQDKSMQAMILNDDTKSWMQPILDFRNNMLAPNEAERDHREFRRMGSNRIILMNDRLVHGPYTQEYRAKLLKELLKTQKEVKENSPDGGFRDVDLIGRDELDEIRRIWVEEKGEIEDVLPGIYKDVYGTEYEGEDFDTVPLSREDFSTLNDSCVQFVEANYASEDKKQEKQRVSELYQLARTLLARSYQASTTHQRSKQLDEIANIVNQFAFLDEAEALDYARKYMGKGQDSKNEVMTASSTSAQEDEEVMNKADNSRDLLV